MTEFARRAAETPLSWLTRLEALDATSLTVIQRRARAAWMAEARRLSDQERQKAKWGLDRK